MRQSCNKLEKGQTEKGATAGKSYLHKNIDHIGICLFLLKILAARSFMPEHSCVPIAFNYVAA